MADSEQVMIMVPRQEWDDVKRIICELRDSARKVSPLEGYNSKQDVQARFGISDRTWSRLKSRGLIHVKTLGGKQFVRADEFISAIEDENQ